MMWVLNVYYRNNKEDRRTYILTVAGNGRTGRKKTCGKRERAMTSRRVDPDSRQGPRSDSVPGASRAMSNNQQSTAAPIYRN